jgi:hypothetical protein
MPRWHNGNISNTCSPLWQIQVANLSHVANSLWLHLDFTKLWQMSKFQHGCKWVYPHFRGILDASNKSFRRCVHNSTRYYRSYPDTSQHYWQKTKICLAGRKRGNIWFRKRNRSLTTFSPSAPSSDNPSYISWLKTAAGLKVSYHPPTRRRQLRLCTICQLATVSSYRNIFDGKLHSILLSGSIRWIIRFSHYFSNVILIYVVCFTKISAQSLTRLGQFSFSWMVQWL